MMNIGTKAALLVASIGLAVAPVAASANTRAGDAGVSKVAASAPGLGRAANGSKASGESIGIALAAIAAVVGGIIILASDGDGDDTVRPLPPVSPGT